MIHFLTYGDNTFSNSKKRLKIEAENFGVFDTISIYNREDISMDFIEKTSPYINMDRGGGYWLWKCFFVKKTFDQINYGDYCVYIDAGCSINIRGKERFFEYLKMIDNEIGVLSFQLEHSEYKWTSEKVFDFLEIEKDSEIRKSEQLVGGILILKKCEYSMNLINKWYDIAINNPDLFSDIYNNNNNEYFIEHRHDQSIFSILRKKYGSVILKDETWSDNWNYLLYEKKAPFLATRYR